VVPSPTGSQTSSAPSASFQAVIGGPRLGTWVVSGRLVRCGTWRWREATMSASTVRSLMRFCEADEHGEGLFGGASLVGHDRADGLAEDRLRPPMAGTGSFAELERRVCKGSPAHPHA
jgi:hypothetical protein